MKNIDKFIAGATLGMWIIFIFNPYPILKICLGFGIGYTITRFLILIDRVA